MKPWAKIAELSRLFSEYAVAQGSVQLLGMLAGLWLVNMLPVREYALYTLGLSIFTFLTVFSDLGVSDALLYFRREARIAQAAFAPYVRAAFRLRGGLLAAGAFVGFVFMATVGRERGFQAGELALVGLVVAAGVWFQVNASIGVLRLRLEGLYRDSYFVEITGNAIRLAAVAAMWLASLPLAWLAMLTGALGSLVTGIAAARRIPDEDGARASADPADRGKQVEGIVRYILPTLLGAAYFSVQGPLSVWLSAYFAGTQSVAEVGALGRLGLIFALLSGFIGAVLLPRLAAVTDDAHYLKRYLQYWVVLVAFGAFVVAFAWAFPHWLLLLLGDAYSGLSEGVLLIAIGSVLTSWAGYTVGINNARGWVRLMPVAVGMFASIQVLLIVVLDLSTTIHVLYYGLWSNLAGVILQIAINAAGFVRPEWVRIRGAGVPVAGQ